MTVFIAVCDKYNINLVSDNAAVLYLIGLLPPAANIIVLETHYMKSGKSTGMIACGTCISIVMIGIYMACILWWH